MAGADVWEAADALALATDQILAAVQAVLAGSGLERDIPVEAGHSFEQLVVAAVELMEALNAAVAALTVFNRGTRIAEAAAQQTPLFRCQVSKVLTCAAECATSCQCGVCDDACIRLLPADAPGHFASLTSS